MIGVLIMAALSVSTARIDRMITRAGCPSNLSLAAAIALHAANNREASTLAALYRTEGLCNVRAIGDHGTSFGAFQINGARWSWLLDDVDAQVETAIAMVRESVRACGRGDAELSVYARGTCSSERGRELSAIRVRLARHARGGL